MTPQLVGWCLHPQALLTRSPLTRSRLTCYTELRLGHVHSQGPSRPLMRGLFRMTRSALLFRNGGAFLVRVYRRSLTDTPSVSNVSQNVSPCCKCSRQPCLRLCRVPTRRTFSRAVCVCIERNLISLLLAPAYNTALVYYCRILHRSAC